MMSEYRRILLKYNEKLYSFINYILSERDGSLYLIFNKKGLGYANFEAEINDNKEILSLNSVVGAIPYWRKVSYHATGQIHINSEKNKPIYGEPLPTITKPQNFLVVSIFNINFLDEFRKIKNVEDYVMEVSSKKGQFVLSFLITPPNCTFKNEGKKFIWIKFGEVFGLCIFQQADELICPENVSAKFIYGIPRKGLFERPQISEREAIKQFYTKIGVKTDIYINGPNKKGEYALIYLVDKPPNARINLIINRKDVNVNIISEDANRMRFNIIDKNGNKVKEPVAIQGASFV